MKDSERLARIDQKLSDFMNLYKEHRAEDKVKFDRLDAVSKKVANIERPLKWAGGVISVAAVGVFTVLGEKAVQWALSAKSAVQHLSK